MADASHAGGIAIRNACKALLDGKSTVRARAQKELLDCLNDFAQLRALDVQSAPESDGAGAMGLVSEPASAQIGTNVHL